MKVRTTFVYPPIPNRNFDWSAVYEDSYDGAEDSDNRNHVGFGPTKEAAKADLIENYPLSPSSQNQRAELSHHELNRTYFRCA